MLLQGTSLPLRQELFFAEDTGYTNTLGMNSVSPHLYSIGIGVFLPDLEPIGHTGQVRYCQPIPEIISLSRSDNDPAGRTMVVPFVSSDFFMLWFNCCCSLTSKPRQGNRNSRVKISSVGHGQKECVVGAQVTVMPIQTISNKAPRGFLWKTTVWEKYKLRQSFVSFILITLK